MRISITTICHIGIPLLIPIAYLLVFSTGSFGFAGLKGFWVLFTGPLSFLGLGGSTIGVILSILVRVMLIIPFLRCANDTRRSAIKWISVHSVVALVIAEFGMFYITSSAQ